MYKVLAFIVLCAGFAFDAQAQSFAPAGGADELKLLEPTDRNPDPKIVEIDLTAKLADVQISGTTDHVWTYNGGLRGSLINTRVGEGRRRQAGNARAQPARQFVTRTTRRGSRIAALE